jgi:hypothetical protein
MREKEMTKREEALKEQEEFMGLYLATNKLNSRRRSADVEPATPKTEKGTGSFFWSVFRLFLVACGLWSLYVLGFTIFSHF